MGKKSVDKLVSGMTISVMNASKTLIKIDGTSHHPTATAIPLTPVAATTEAPVEERFLPGTVLKKGAKGPTAEILRQRMQKLYEEGYITIEPTVEHSAFTQGMLLKDNPIAGMEIMENEKTAALWDAVEEYINNGVNYAMSVGKDSKYPSNMLKMRAAIPNYDVNINVWRSLSLPCCSKLDEMFKIISNTGGNTINLILSGNDITIEYRPSFYVERNDSEIKYKDEFGVDRTITARLPVKPADEPKLYEDYILKGLQGVHNWLNETPQIQEKAATIKIKLYDVNGNTHLLETGKGAVTSADLASLDFIAKSKNDATIYIEENYSGFIVSLATMVWDSIDWKKDKKLQIHVRNHGVGYSDWSVSGFERLIEHEFGHVLGLFDIYGYAEHFGDLIGNATLPEANTDGTHVTEFSPMFCKWEKDPWRRTNTDWEMIMYAWQDNQLQLYIDSALGKQSQAYFH